MRIVSEMISMTYNEKGESIDGDPDAIVEIKDIWTFVRNSLSSDPNWKLLQQKMKIKISFFYEII